MTLSQYLDNLNRRYQTGISREHSYRGDLQTLLESIVPDVLVTNEPQRVACGAPDYILTRKSIPVGYVEAKDLGADVNSKSFKEQFDRYKASLTNLIFTNYIDFHLYRDGVFVTSISLGNIIHGQVAALPQHFDTFTNLIKDFSIQSGQTIKSPKKLAEMMAGKARMLSEVIKEALTSDEKNDDNSTLKDQMNGFQQILIHDITPKEFADIYAQTVAYGMFAARLHDPTLPTFSRQEAAELIPKTNPFLRKLFGYIAGPDIDGRILWIVDGLADIFRATDIAALLSNFGRSTQTSDPIIHFYETFLSEYDPKLRKARGVWYTPEPVVNFIVRAVDDILKDEFGLKDGLADTTKITIKTKGATKATADMRSKIKEVEVEQEVHKVQILDPATGTGTFLAEVVKQIHSRFKGQQGIWSNYVENHLIPRLNGFELLMASYAMAHLKLDLLLTETGYKPKKEQRFKIFLTNSLEEHHPDAGTLFANWLSDEANEASWIKRDTPVMVVIGNPPYSVSSTNKSEWIQNLIADYKKDLNERKINLDDDYIKFIRFGQHFIDKNGEGVLAYISNNSFIDGITHRQMRKHLLESFDKIYILDLHGNAKKKEVAPDGSTDENVFDIMQGVSINLLIKSNKKRKIGEVLHYNLYGKREDKYESLVQNSLKTINWNNLQYDLVNYFFVPRKTKKDSIYEAGFELEKLFVNKNTGIQTKNDALTIQFSLDDITRIESDFLNMDVEYLRKTYGITDGTWMVSNAKADLLSGKYNHSDILIKPFDVRYTLLNRISSGFLGRPRYSTMRHMETKNNYALLLSRQNKSNTIDSFFITNTISEMKSAERTIQSYHFPLYLYPEKTTQQSFTEQPERTPNLNMAIVGKIADSINHVFLPDENIVCDLPAGKDGHFSPLNLLDYIYGVLHSPNYREKYKEFLKIDFPRVPYPKDAATFWQLAKLGSGLRSIHLLESPVVNQYITQYPIDGNNEVSKVKYEDGKAYINETQYFDNVPIVAWQFYIGGYKPAQKWLKDRKGRDLNFDDILHYQKIIVALSETDRLMKEIGKIEIE